MDGNNNHKPTAAETFMAMKYGNLNNNSNDAKSNDTASEVVNIGNKKYKRTVKKNSSSGFGQIVFWIISILAATILVPVISVCIDQISTVISKNNEVAITNGQYVINSTLTKVGSVKVINETGSNCYIYFESTDSNSDIAGYVQEDNSATFYIPKGDYEVYYCLGDIWQGEDKKFGSSSEYYKSTSSLYFGEYIQSEYELTLYTSYNKNFGSSMKGISKSGFPD